MIATTRQQSKRLLACGIKADTADMVFLYYDDEGQCSYDNFKELVDNGEDADCSVDLVPKTFSDYDTSYTKDSPAWSLSALLELIPKEMDGFKCTFAYDNYGEEGFFITDSG